MMGGLVSTVTAMLVAWAAEPTKLYATTTNNVDDNDEIMYKVNKPLTVA